VLFSVAYVNAGELDRKFAAKKNKKTGITGFEIYDLRLN
jgi:hypothetical protein